MVASSSEAHVQFVAPNLQLHSRDLNLSTGAWESNYVVQTSTAPILSLSAATLSNTIFCLIAQTPGQTGPQPQNFYLVSRLSSDQNWSAPQYVTTTTSGIGGNYMRNTIVASPSNASAQKVFVATTCNTQSGCADQVGITLRTYSSSGGFEVAEPIYNGNTDASGVFLSASRFGAYAYWSGSMRRKPFALTGTISERTLLTGKNWVSYGPTDGVMFDYNVSVDALDGAETTVFWSGEPDISTVLRVNGVLNADKNSKFRFGYLAKLEINGQMIANEANFEALDPPVPWFGIVNNSGTRLSTMQYCTVSDASIGVGSYSSRLSISDSRFLAGEFGDFGIWVENTNGVKYFASINRCYLEDYYYSFYITASNNVTLRDNTVVSGNQAGVEYGAQIFSSSPFFYGNRISYPDYGVEALNYSNPRFGYYLNDPGNNTIEAGEYTVKVDESSAFLGLATPDGIMGGDNCLKILGSPFVGYLGWARNASTIVAEKNKWPTDPPEAFRFSTDVSSKIDYSLSLPACLTGNSPFTDGGQEHPEIMTPEEQLLKRAQFLRARREYDSALVIYRALLTTRPHFSEARNALRELRHTYHDYAFWSGDEGHRSVMRTFLQNQVITHPNAAMRLLARTLYAAELLAREEYSDAHQHYSQLLSIASTNNQRLDCLWSLFCIKAVHAPSRSEAEQYLAELRQISSTDSRTQLAAIVFSAMPEGAQSNSHRFENDLFRSSVGAIDENPLTTELDQNFPNPFNPKTTIRFHIPDNSFVALRVYDILGREVATLVYEERLAGSYDEVFDGSALASGVYIYVLKAGNFAASKKLLLVK